MKGIDSVDPNFSGSTRTTFSCDKCSISPSRKEVVLLAQSSSSSTELIPTPIGICWVSPSLLNSPRSPVPGSLSSLCYAPPAQAVPAAFSPPNAHGRRLWLELGCVNGSLQNGEEEFAAGFVLKGQGLSI
ncbi:unnamed protein product [Prunus armeniaca]|uniref:Uncharacterized protein n=1 Tax=Prunus armeniaca TaxID=36596 RepID=A0A6J5WE80_PRUAR|nr:unnamed protein product [Prunus armeniaca]